MHHTSKAAHELSSDNKIQMGSFVRLRSPCVTCVSLQEEDFSMSEGKRLWEQRRWRSHCSWLLSRPYQPCPLMLHEVVKKIAKEMMFGHFNDNAFSCSSTQICCTDCRGCDFSNGWMSNMWPLVMHLHLRCGFTLEYVYFHAATLGYESMHVFIGVLLCWHMSMREKKRELVTGFGGGRGGGAWHAWQQQFQHTTYLTCSSGPVWCDKNYNTGCKARQTAARRAQARHGPVAISTSSTPCTTVSTGHRHV